MSTGFGGKVAECLRAHSLHTIRQVQALSLQSLTSLTQLKRASAQSLLDFAHGIDPCVPAARGPPKTISLQMTLTPVPLPIHPSWKSGGAIGGTDATGGTLQPLFIHGSDSGQRMRELLSVMLHDLADRVLQDRCVTSTLTIMFVFRSVDSQIMLVDRSVDSQHCICSQICRRSKSCLFSDLSVMLHDLADRVVQDRCVLSTLTSTAPSYTHVCHAVNARRAGPRHSC